MSNQGGHKWCFKKDQYQQFLEDNEDNEFEYKTEEFTIGGFKWIIVCAPKDANFTILLTLHSALPPNVDYILVQHKQHCIDTYSSLTLMNKFDRDNKSWGANGEILSLQEMKNINQDVISFWVNIKIIQVVTKNKVLFMDRLLVNSDQRTINWTVKHDQLMNYFKTARNGKLFESPLKSDSMFVIRCCPNGYSKEYKGKVSFGFRIIHSPVKHAEVYRIKYILSCNQIGISQPLRYEGTIGVENPTPIRGWTSIGVDFEDLVETIKELQSKDEDLIINVKYEIFEYTDNNKIIHEIPNSESTDNDYNQCLRLLNTQVNQDMITDITQEIKEEKQEEIVYYNNNIVNQLVNSRMGTKEECIRASRLVNDPNDIEAVADKMMDMKAQLQHDEDVSHSNTNNMDSSPIKSENLINDHSNRNQMKMVRQINDAISQIPTLIHVENASNFYEKCKQNISTKFDEIQEIIRENEYSIHEIYERIEAIWVNVYALPSEQIEKNANDISAIQKIEQKFYSLLPAVDIKSEESEDNNASNHNKKESSDNWIRGDDVKMFLENIKLPEYYDKFMDKGYDDMDFIRGYITEDDLERIGITKYGHIQRILIFANKKRALEDEQDEMDNDDAKIKLENDNHNHNNQPPNKKRRME